MSTVPRVAPPQTPEEFEKYVTASRPVVFEGACAHWPAIEAWKKPEYFRSKLPDMRIPVRRKTTLADEYQSTLYHVVDGCFSDGNCDEYVGGAPIPPPLVDDISGYPFHPDDKGARLIWLGKDTWTECHFHYNYDTLLAQVVGTKRIRLAAPEETHRLYLHPLWSMGKNGPHTSRIPRDASLSDFPKLRDVTWIDTEITPGDVLFIPIYWWHEVIAPSLSMNVTQWWGTTEDLVKRNPNFSGPLSMNRLHLLLRSRIHNLQENLFPRPPVAP